MRIVFKLLKWLFGALVAAIIAFLIAIRVAPPELLQVGDSYAAKIACSNVFLAGRDAQKVLADDVQAPGNPILKAVMLDVDKDKGKVTARLLGSAVFFLSIAPLSWQLGVNGAAIACVIGNIATATVMVVQLVREYRRVRRPRPA